MNPSKRLTEFLSTYLDLDGKQLKIGLWGGDLKIQDVDIKSDAFDKLLNTWKDTEGVGVTGRLDLSYFLSKEALVEKEPSLASTLDLKLVKGKIGYFRARVPWKNLLLGAGDDTVHIDLRDVTIQLGLESRIAKLLKGRKCPFTRINEPYRKKSSNSHELHGFERRWKQEMIRIAEQCHADKKDIPSPAEFAELKAEFLSKEKSTIEEFNYEQVKLTFLERFVQSFASSIGWRIGRGLKVKIQNIRIIMVHGGVEVGLVTESFELFEYNHGDHKSKGTAGNQHVESPASFSSSESKRPSDAEQGNHADRIRKNVKISNCGIFAKAATKQTGHLRDPIIDEYIVQPANATISLCLRKTGISIELQDTERDEDAQPSEKANLCDSDETKKPRRGKRDRRRKFSEISKSPSAAKGDSATTDTNFRSPQNNSEVKIASRDGENAHSQLSIDCQRSCDGIDFEESSASFSTNIQMDGLVVAATTRSLDLLRRFMKRITNLKNGRPCGDMSDYPLNTLRRKEFSRQMFFYCCFCVLRDNRRRELTKYFCIGGSWFDESAQRLFRQKYIELHSTEKDEKIRVRKRIEDKLPVEQIILYRNSKISSPADVNPQQNVSFRPGLNTKGYAGGSHRSILSFGGDELRLHSQKRHRYSKSVGDGKLLSHSDGSRRVPSHQRNQSLNVDTMNDFLDYIPASRYQRYSNFDLVSVAESTSFEDTSIRENFESMQQFDSAILRDKKARYFKRESSNSSERSQSIGSVSSSISFLIAELKLFVCKETNGHCSGDVSDSEGSAFTMNSVPLGVTKEGSVRQEEYQEGSLHCILASLVVGAVRLSSYKDLGEKTKVKTFSVDSIFCQLRDSVLIRSGRVQCIPGCVGNFSVGSNRNEPKSIETLSAHEVCEKIEVGVPFIQGDVLYDTHNSLSHPRRVQILCAEIDSTLDLSSIVLVMDNTMPSDKTSHSLSPMTGIDRARFEVAKSVAGEFEQREDIDLKIEVNGVRLTVPISSDGGNSSTLEVDTSNKNISASINKLVLRQGSFIDGNSELFRKTSVVSDISDTCFQNMLLTCADFDMVFGNEPLFEVALNTEVLYSKSTDIYPLERPRQRLVVLLSPMSVVLTQKLAHNISSTWKAFQDVGLVKSSHTEAKEFARPRLKVCAKFRKLHVQAIFSSLRVAIASESPSLSGLRNADHRDVYRLAMSEILLDTLSLLICFPPPFLSTSAESAKNIALGRLSAMALSNEEAQKCLSFAINRLIQRLEVLQTSASLAKNKSVLDAAGLSPRNLDLKNRKLREGDELTDRLLKLVVEDTIVYTSNIQSECRADWSKALIFECPDGFQIGFERFFYDWVITGKVKACNLRNGSGRKLVTVSGKTSEVELGNSDPVSSILTPNDHDEGLLLTFIQKDLECEVGEGNKTFYELSSDATVEFREDEKKVQAYFGVLQIHFSDIDFTDALESFSNLFQFFESEMNTGIETEATRNPTDSASVSLDFTYCEILLCTDDFQPFTKVAFEGLSVDAVSNQALNKMNQKVQLVAQSDALRLFDLSPEGQIFEQVITPKQKLDNQDACFFMRMTISSNTYHCPSELFVVLTGIRFFLLRRYLNELKQFFLSPQYGIGHFVSIHSSHAVGTNCHDSYPHPMRYQLHLVESSGVCPKNSKSNELIAFRSSKIALSNSFLRESFPVNNTCPVDAEPCESKDGYHPGNVHAAKADEDTFISFQNLSSDSIIFDDDTNHSTIPAFDASSILRITVSVEDVNIFSGLPCESNDDTDTSDFVRIVHFLEIGDIKEGCAVFKQINDLPEDIFSKKEQVSKLCSRAWETITQQPIQLEIYADFLSQSTRILLKDNINYDDDECGEYKPFDIKLRMSQFYALLSTWYGNMQELPVLFPYSMQDIRDGAEVQPCPEDWPEYGSRAYVDRMRCNRTKTMEMFVSFTKLRWHCLFDPADYFAKPLNNAYMIRSFTDEILIEAEALSFLVDFDDQQVMRVGCKSGIFEIKDLRTKSTVFCNSLSVLQPAKDNVPKTGNVDMEWGLDRSMTELKGKLDNPFQATIFMTPDRCCLVNIGMAKLHSCAHDLAFFWILLEYFTAYFQSHEFGNPYFEAERNRLQYLKSCNIEEDTDEKPCLNLDVRLWLTRPRITIPSNPMDRGTEMLVLESQRGGLFYRYRTIDYDFSSQNLYTRNMDMLFLSCESSPSKNMRNINLSKTRFLGKCLNLNVQYEWFVASNHMNVSISSYVLDRINDVVDGIESTSAQAKPLQLPPPTVCNPRFTFSKYKNTSSTCEINIDPERFKEAVDLMYKFVGPFPLEDLQSGAPESNYAQRQSIEPSISITTELIGIKLIICDPVLGMHLPIASIYISELHSSVSKLKFENLNEDLDFQACADTQMWIDYYKSGPTRSWEPFLEPYKCTILYEKSSRRGQGVTVNSESPLHLNISGALLDKIDFATGSIFQPIFESFGKDGSISSPLSRSNDRGDLRNIISGSVKSMKEKVELLEGKIIDVTHEEEVALSPQSRAAFTLINLSGHRIRFHQQGGKKEDLSLCYLDHRNAAALSFPPTRSVFRNLQVVEVSAENSTSNSELSANGHTDSSHFIDIQVPGMHWCRAVCVDKTGKRFIGLQPRSLNVTTKNKKIDWRQSNLLCLLAEVSSFEGGRQITLSSPVEIINKTRHKIRLAFHIDAKHFENMNDDDKEFSTKHDEKYSNFDCDIKDVLPDESHHIPSVLFEAALNLQTDSLGHFWVKPQENDETEFLNSLRGNEHNSATDVKIAYSTRPVNVLDLVEESSFLFKKGNLQPEQMNTQYHLFCPITEEEKGFVSPFCYCVEVRRSPVVSPFPGHGDTENVHSSTTHSRNVELGYGSTSNPQSYFPDEFSSYQDRKQYFTEDDKAKDIHGPVAYSLVIHPPIVIENLLPERARFELMHATKRKVVWWGDLDPGDSLPIHTVGLDSPLLLSMNVGYCRTPIGEGALIHHGADVMKQVKNRGPQQNEDGQQTNETNTSNQLSKNALDLEDTNISAARSTPYDFAISPDEVASSTTVIDSIGQRLSINIDNTRGAGGQRHVTVSCPYWIVNTTEHALRYKQEMSPSFVSGSIHSETKDGSQPVDSSKRNNMENYDHLQKTIFPGKPGALFGVEGKINLPEYTTLLGKDIPLDMLASLAFMFNYKESHPFGGFERLSIQLTDHLNRCSEWSRGFSLESVGVTQIVGMHCLDGKQLEVAAIVTVAQGALSKYTKIVRICPRYVLINQLPRPIRLWQDSSLIHPSRVLDASKDGSRGSREQINWTFASSKSQDISTNQYDFLFGQPTKLDYRDTNMPKNTVAHRSAFYITTAEPNKPIPFHLPDTRADRELRVDLGPSWNLSASFPADVISDYALKLTRVVDLRLLKHVDNRGASKYKVQLPPINSVDFDMDLWDGELGIWFETIQWNGNTKCIVKGTKRGKYSHNNTDIHVGDELLAIDGNSVAKDDFSTTMEILKKRLSEVSIAYKMRRQQNQKPPRNHQKVKKPKFLKHFGRSASIETSNSGSEVDSLVAEDDDVSDVPHEQPLTTLTLEFQTLEYRMKRVRDRALKKKKDIHGRKRLDVGDSGVTENISSGSARAATAKNPQKVVVHKYKADKDLQIQVSTKVLNQSVFVFVNEANGVAPYRIENRSVKEHIYFRQRSCENHDWNSLAPGESCSYTWEEPLKPNKLLVRVWNQNCHTIKEKTGAKFLPFKFVASEDQGSFGPSKVVKIDEVGFEGIIPCFDKGNQRENPMLFCTVDTDGATRVLIVSDANTSNGLGSVSEWSRTTGEINLLNSHLQQLSENIDKVKSKLAGLEKKRIDLNRGIRQVQTMAQISSHHLLPTVQEDTESSHYDAKALPENSSDDNFNQNCEDGTITRIHQLVVEVIEASGLHNASNTALAGLCSPYCSLRLEDRSSKSRANIFTKDDVKRTYFIERCSSPKWTGMKFVFDVPQNAVADPNGFAVQVKVKDHRLIGRDRPLGRTEIHMRNLKNQKEVIGWFPLLSKMGRGSDPTNPVTAGRAQQGSVKLRAQWIYTEAARLDYSILLCESRISELQANRDGIKAYHEKLQSDERKNKELDEAVANIPLLSSKMTRPTFTPKLTSVLKQGMRPKKLLQRLKRQHQSPEGGTIVDQEHTARTSEVGESIESESVLLPFHNVLNSKTPISSSKSDKSLGNISLQFSPRPVRGIAYSEGDVFTDNLQSPLYSPHNQSSIANSQSINQKETILGILFASNVLHNHCGGHFHHNHIGCISDRYADAYFHCKNITSWVLAYEIMNDKILSRRLMPEGERKKLRLMINQKKIMLERKMPYTALALPHRAPSIIQTRNISFQNHLCTSREHFDKAAQRSLMAVLNRGGWLNLRPITALRLPEMDEDENKFKGMFVRVQYGSKSCVTSTVKANVSPKWADDSFDAEMSSSSQNSKRNNTLEVQVEPLKTSGALQLSVFGTRMNTKVELGVLQIPLSHAISCCTEASENVDSADAFNCKYVRWFPLKKPKDCVEGDGKVCYRPTDFERTEDNKFSIYDTPCIMLEMWWVKKNSKEEQTEDYAYEEQSNRTTDNVHRSLTEYYFHASIDSISAALIDSFKARELLSLTSVDTDIRYSHTKSTTQIGIAMAHLQLDQHLEKALEPVVLCPRPVPNPQPTIQFLAIKNNIRSKSNLDSFKHIAIALEEMDLRIEETWMFDVWELFHRVLRRHHAMKKSLLRSSAGERRSRPAASVFTDDSPIGVVNEIVEAMSGTRTHQDESGSNRPLSKQIYIEEFMLAPLQINVSYIKNSRVTVAKSAFKNDFVTISPGKYVPQVSIGKNQNTEESVKNSIHGNTEIFRQWSELGHHEDWSTNIDQRTRSFQNVISAAFPAITNAPIRVNGKQLDNVFNTWGEITADLKHYYTNACMFQVYKILGSVDLFGNPTMAVNSIMKGAHDFVVLPFREFLRSPNNPSKFGIGVAKGTLSLVSHFFSGVFGFVSNISEAGGTAAATLSFDEHFKRWHKQQVADHFRHMHGQFRPQGFELVLSAVTRPLQDVIAGLLFATSGLLVEPYRGAQLKGITGFTRGIGIGTAGLITKPLVGVFDAFAHLSESINDVARSANILDKKIHSVTKMRLPYVFGLHKILLPYNSVDSCSANLLRLFPVREKKRSRSENTSDEVLVLSKFLQRDPGLGWYLVVTTKRIVKFIVRHDASVAPVLDWQVDLRKDLKITSTCEDSTQVIFKITTGPIAYVPSQPKSQEHVSDFEGKIVDHPGDSALHGYHDVIDQTESESLKSRKEQKIKSAHNPRSTFGSKAKKKQRAAYVVYGEFGTDRDALIQIHNAICCLTGQFASVRPRISNTGIRVSDSSEGYTSFGPLHFDGKHVASYSKNDATDYLDAIPWVYNFTEDQVKSRSEWVYSDELQASKDFGGGPDWMAEARARGTYLVKVETSGDGLKHTEEENEQLQNRLFQPPDTSGRAQETFTKDTEVAEPPPGIIMEFEGEEPSLIEPAVSTVEERLDNVENMLQQLLHNQVNVQSNAGNISYSQQRKAYHPTSNVSTVSALTGIGDHAQHNIAYNSAENEADQLRRQVERLQEELDNRDKEALKWREEESQSTDKRKRKRRFKKLWKS